MNNIGTMILYSTQCDRFIRKSIEQCKKFSSKICIITSDKSFDGSDGQDKNLLFKLYEQYKSDDQICIVELKWNNEIIFEGRETYEESMRSGKGWRARGWYKGWLGISRYTGWLQLKDITDFTLFLDSDELVEGDKFKKWTLDLPKYTDIQAFKFLNYWYLNDVTLQSTKYEDSMIMIRNINYPEKFFFTDAERHGMCDGSLIRLTDITFENRPMIHHYSYVRDKAGLEMKLKETHAQESGLNKNINQNANKILSGQDIIHGYQYKEVENIFNL